MARVRVIGLGNPHRGDDAAGHHVAVLIRRALPAGLADIRLIRDGSGLLPCLPDVDALYVVDAVRSGAVPGTVRRIDASTEALPGEVRSASTHLVGLADAVELARVMGTLPGKTIVYGIEIAVTDLGAPVSNEVAGSCAVVAGRIMDEVLAS